MKIFVLLTLVAGALAVQSCGENEHYKRCGTACPLTCENYDNPPKVCVLMCKVGCACDEGYVRAQDGRCVKPENCANRAPQCPENQHYENCGTACPLTCENYLNPPKFCVLRCDIGCACDKGYVKTKDGRCVLPEECSSQAPDSLDVCDLAPETGPCRALFHRYHFDRTSGECKKFVYGGCGGNGNNFKTEAECKITCARQQALDRPDCDKGFETGLCKAYIPRFYYDQEAGMCKKFIYGGCGGNRNNFKTEAECYNKCGALATESACDQEKKVGECRAAFPRYYFNKQSGQCELFIYGGCRGNDNNFLSKDECESTCVA